MSSTALIVGSSVQASTIPDSSFIPSFYSRAYFLMMNIRWLNPSRVESKCLEKVGRSVKETFEINADKIDNLLVLKPRTDIFYRYFHRPVAGTLRLAISVALSFYVAPIGMAFNGAAVIFYIGKYVVTDSIIRRIYSDNVLKLAQIDQGIQKDLDNAFCHLKGLGCDILMGLPYLSKAILARLPLHMIRSIFQIIKITLPASTPIVVGFFTLLAAPLIAPFYSEFVISLSMDEEQRVGLHQSLLLGKEYGIRGPQGQFIEPGAEDDETLEGNGYFFTLYNDTASEIVKKLNILLDEKIVEMKSSQKYKDEIEGVQVKEERCLTSLKRRFFDTVPYGDCRMKYSYDKDSNLDAVQLKMRRVKSEFKHLFKKFDENHEVEFSIKSKDLETLYYRFFRLREILTELDNCREDRSGDKKINFKIPSFFLKEGFGDFSKNIKIAGDSWLKLVQSLNDGNVISLDNGKPTFVNEDFTNLYVDFRDKVLKKVAPEELLVISEGQARTPQAYKKSYHKLLLAVHPDKLPAGSSGALRTEADILFKILLQALIVAEK
ncbi:MAG: J domain-containing protein [Parachlamydiales bacterium]|jgi:hypothetical protein